MTKNERIAELEEEIRQLRAELEMLKARPVYTPMYAPAFVPPYPAAKCPVCGAFGSHVCASVYGFPTTGNTTASLGVTS